MGKTKVKKKIISIVSVIGLLLAIVFYTQFTTKAELNEVTVAIANNNIPPRTQITKEMINVVTVPARSIPGNAITKPDDLVGKWTVQGYGLSKNSYFYEEKVVPQQELPDEALLKLEEGEVAVPILVDLESSLGNSIIPDTYVDLTFKQLITDNNEMKAVAGDLMKNVKVISVKDASASNVFTEDASSVKGDEKEGNTLAKIYIFAVPEEMYAFIDKAKLLGTVAPVATGNTYKEDLETEIPTNAVTEFITAKSK